MTCRRPDWEGAIRAWREVVGPEQVLTGAAIKARYGPGTTPVEREIPALVMPGTTAEVQAIDATARTMVFETPESHITVIWVDDLDGSHPEGQGT